MKLLGLALAVCVAVLGAGVAPAGEASKDPAVEKLVADWTAAFSKGDAKALASLYSDDAVRVTEDGGTTVGRAAIEKEFASNFGGPWKGATIVIEAGSRHAVGSGVMINEGTWEVSGTGPDGKPLKRSGWFVNTLVKKGDVWMIAANAAVPRASAAAR